MPKTKGAKNKPRNLETWAEKLKNEAKKQGKNIQVVIDAVPDSVKSKVVDKVVAGVERKAGKTAGKVSRQVLELAVKKKEETPARNTYQCGACGTEFAEQLPKCPVCGVSLKW